MTKDENLQKPLESLSWFLHLIPPSSPQYYHIFLAQIGLSLSLLLGQIREDFLLQIR